MKLINTLSEQFLTAENGYNIIYYLSITFQETECCSSIPYVHELEKVIISFAACLLDQTVYNNVVGHFINV